MNRAILASISIVLAIANNIAIQSIAGAGLTEVGERCFAGDDVAIAFEPLLGGAFVCIMTTFFHGLTQDAGGVFAWGTLVTIAYPFFVLAISESARSGVKGPILKYPIIIMVLSQYIALSVAVPLIWVPFYLLWGRGTTLHGYGNMHSMLSIGNSAFFACVSLLFFTLDTESYAWTFTTGLLAGPFMPFPLILQLFLPKHSGAAGTPVASSSSKLLIKTFHIAMVAAFVQWVLLAGSFLRTVGFDGLWASLWGEANYSIQIINLDIVVWSLALLIVLCDENPMDAVRAFVLAPWVGPGAALSYTFAKQEQARLARQQLNTVKSD